MYDRILRTFKIFIFPFFFFPYKYIMRSRYYAHICSLIIIDFKVTKINMQKQMSS